MQFGGSIECTYTIGQFCTFLIKWKCKRTKIFWCIGWRYDFEIYEVGEMCTDCWWKVIDLDDEWSCRWAISSTFEEQVTVSTEREGNVSRIAEVAVCPLMTVNHNFLVKQATIMLTIEDITNATRDVHVVITIT